jgi:formylglycine-generating enzyme required for sulfatase activity
MSTDTAAIRQFLNDRFSDDELTTLSFDYFPEVYQEFSTGMSKGTKIQLLLDYCQRRDQLPALLAMLERERPEAYRAQFQAAARAESAATQPRIERNPRQIFISHSHEDAVFAQRLADDLRGRGWPVWIAPDSIRPGEKWVEAINRGLDESGIIALVLTPEAIKSRWVQSETSVAIELEHKGSVHFVPLELKSAELPPLWRAYQRLPFGQGYAVGLKSLLAELSLSTTPPIHSEEQPPAGKAEPKPEKEVHPGLALLLSVKPKTVDIGSEARWAVTLRNDGDDNLQYVTLRRGRALLDDPFDLARGKGRRFTYTTTYKGQGEKTEKVTASGIASDGTTVLKDATESVTVRQARKKSPEPESVPATGTALLRVSRPEELERIQGRRIIWEKDDKEMVRVPAGKFLYGDGKEEKFLPGFWIDKTPVTNAEYARFVADTDQEPPRHWKGASPPKKLADHPVVYVSWHDAVAYAEWAGKDLPAEEEWEKAARGTDGRKYPWGDQEPTEELCNFGGNVGTTTPVGRYSPRGDGPYGCVDMSGNVWEWTVSKYVRILGRVLRGGSWGSRLDRARAAYRYFDVPNLRSSSSGFRVLVRRPPSQ